MEAPKSLPRASQELLKAFKRPPTAFKSLPSGPREDSKNLLCRPFYIFGQKTQIPKLSVQAQSPPALLARAQHMATVTHFIQLHAPFFFMMPSCTYAWQGCTYVLGTESKVAGATLDRRGANVSGSEWTHRDLYMGITWRTVHPPIFSSSRSASNWNEEGRKNLRLSQLKPTWHHDPGSSVYQLTHTDSQIYKHISHTLNVALRLNY